MKAKGERFLLVGGVPAVFVIVAAIGFKTATEGRREAAVAKLKQLPGFEKLARTDKTAKQSQAADQTDRSDPSDSIARFAQLFDRTTDAFASKEWTSLFGKRPGEWSDEEWKQAEALAAGLEDLIRDIRNLAEQGGRIADVDFSKGFDADTSHLTKLRELVNLLAIDARRQARAGNCEVAVQDILAMMKLADCLVDEPLSMSQAVRLSLNRDAYDTARAISRLGSLSSDQARSLMRYAGQNDHREAFTDGLCEIGESTLTVFERIRQGEPIDPLIMKETGDPFCAALSPLGGLAYALYHGDRGAVALNAYRTTLAAPWRDMDEASYASFLPAIIDASRLPYYQAYPLMEQIRRDIDSLPVTRFVSRTSLPFLLTGNGLQARNEAMLDLMQLGLAVEQYHAQNGAYPASLDAVASELGGSIPVDPFTGQPYLYRVSDGDYLIYSVGQNLVDDGGRDEPIHGDIVWGPHPVPAPAYFAQ